MMDASSPTTIEGRKRKKGMRIIAVVIVNGVLVVMWSSIFAFSFSPHNNNSS